MIGGPPPGPGPEERKLRNRLVFMLTGRWPESVVAERLADLPLRAIQAGRETDAWIKEMWTDAREE